MNEISGDQTPPPAFSRGFALKAALLCALVFVIYWPAIRGEFVWDDLLTVVRNPLVTGQSTLTSIWGQADFPLATIALWVEWSLWNKHTLGYHLVNVLLHAANVLLLWRVLARLKIPGAGIAAALFAVHPVCVASVAWISELKNTLSLFFCLWSVWWYLGSEELAADNAAGRLRNYILAIIAFVLALLTKTSVVMLPVVLLLLNFWRQGKMTKPVVLRVLPFFGLSLVAGLLTIYFQSHAIKGVAVQGESFVGRFAVSGIAAWFYLWKALVPFKLSIIYPRWGVETNSVLAYLPLLALVIVFAAGGWLRKPWLRNVLLGFACYVILLLPILGFFDMSYFAISRVSDHFQYLPLMALLVLVGAGLSRLPAKVGKFAVPALVAGLALLTFLQSRVFATEEALWRDTIAKNPDSWNARNNLACILAEKGKINEAVSEFEASLKLNPRNTKALCNLGRAAMINGRLAEAEQRFLTALKIKPDEAEAHRLYGEMLANAGRLGPALEHLRDAVRAQPDPESRILFAQLLMAAGQPALAAEQYREVLKVAPHTVDALNNLAGLLATSWDDRVRNGGEAIQLAAQAMHLTGNKQPIIMGTLAAAYAEAGRYTDAVKTAEAAAKIATAANNPQLAEMHKRLAGLYGSGKPFHLPPPKPVAPPNSK